MRGPASKWRVPRRRIGAWVGMIGLLAWPLAAEVLVVRLPDGTRLVRNPTPSVQRPAGGQTPTVGTAASLPGVGSSPPHELRLLVHEAAELEGVDPRLVEAVVRAESGWNPAALSHKGAIGLMQLMPATATELAVEDPWDAAENVRGGVRYLADLLARFDRLEHAVAAYNAGPSAVERYRGVPPYPETRTYVKRVLAFYDGREADLGTATGRGPAPRLVRTADGRLVLTNTPSSLPAPRPAQAPAAGSASPTVGLAVAAR